MQAIEGLRSIGHARIESTMVLEAAYEGEVERSRPIESVYVVAEPDAAGVRAMIRMKGYRMTVGGDVVYVEHEDAPNAYVRLAGEGTPLDRLRGDFRSLPDPLLDLLIGSGVEVPPGVPVESTEAGGMEVRIDRAANGRLTLILDESGRLIEAIHDQAHDASLPDGMRLRSTWAYHWDDVDQDEAVEAVRFRRNGRQRLDDPAALRTNSKSKSDTAVSKGPAPDLQLTSLAGDAVRLQDLRGKVVVLDFWATWCAPCRRSLVAIQSMAEEYERLGLPVRFLAVNVHERGDPVGMDARIERFAEAIGLELEILVDRRGVVAGEWGISSIPVSIVVDSDGAIVHRSEGFGPGTVESLRAVIDPLLEAPSPE